MRKKGTSPAGNALPVGEEMDVLFHAVDVPLSFAPEAIEHTLRPGEVREEHFTIRSEGGTGAEGFVSSSKPCVEPLSARFAGSMDEITYRMDAKHFESGDEVQGYFRIFSTEGEYRLPYTLRVEEDQIRSELGSIQSLAHFLNLAKTDFEEACVLFYSPAFAALVAKEDEHAYGIYRGLSARPGNRQNVEEFLIAVLG